MAERLFVSGLGWRVVAAPFFLFNNLILNVIYKILFFDKQNQIIATRFLSTDKAKPPMKYVLHYCHLLSEYYPEIKLFKIYECRCFSILESNVDCV